jgi:hypothetical protein
MKRNSENTMPAPDISESERSVMKALWERACGDCLLSPAHLRQHTNRIVAAAAVSFMLLSLLGVTRAEKAVPESEAGAWIGMEITFSRISKEVSGFNDDLKSWLEGNSEAHTISNEVYEELLRHLPSTKSSYPRMVIRNAQEASIRSVVNQPVPDAKQSSGVSYLPIGIVLGITPTHRDGKLQLDIDINDSHKIGEEKTPSGPMPIVKSWVFQSSAEVPLGHSLVLWNKAERKLYALRPTLVSGKDEGSPKNAMAAEGLIAKKLKGLIFPSVQFSGATLEEALEFLRVKSRQLDTSEPNEARRGVNFILQDGSASTAVISLDVKNVPLSEVVKYTADLAGMSYRVEETGVIFLPRSNDSAAKPASPINGKAIELAKKIILPHLQFQSATIEEVLDSLRNGLQHLFEDEEPSARVNLLLKSGGDPKAIISLDLKDVSAYDALRYIAELSGHTLSADDHSIILRPR